MREINDIPKGWELKSIKEAFEIGKDKGVENSVPYLEIGDIDISSKRYLLKAKPAVKGCKISNKGDLLISRVRPTRGAIVQIKEEFIPVSSAFTILKKNKLFFEAFPFYYFAWNNEFLNYMGKNCSGSLYPTVSEGILTDYKIVIPPFKEQELIVSKIEELLSELENGKQLLLIAQQQLSIYRKSLIMQGITGKLTSNWRDNNPHVGGSEESFQKIQENLDRAYEKACEKAILDGKRKPKDQRKNKKTINVEVELPELPSNWNYYRLEEITYLVTDGTHFTPKYQDSGVKFLSVKNVRPFYFREEDVKYISDEEHKRLIDRCNPQKDDILYTKVGATFGYAARVTMDYEFSIFVSLCLIKPVKECISSKFLEFLMNSELVFKQARRRVSGSGVPDLHLIEIRDFKIPLPSIEEQQVIVTELESKLSICDKIEETISQSLHQSEILRQSILKKAFEGKLV